MNLFRCTRVVGFLKQTEIVFKYRVRIGNLDLSDLLSEFKFHTFAYSSGTTHFWGTNQFGQP